MQESNTPETVAQAAVAPTPIVPAAVEPATTAPVVASAEDDRNKTLLLVAYILNLVSTIIAAVAIIPLAWMIPMTVISYGIYKGKKQNTTTFGVCTLLFVNVISGILLLIAKKDD